MTKKHTPEPAEEPVRIKLSGDMAGNGDVLTIAGKHDIVRGDAAKKDSTDGR